MGLGQFEPGVVAGVKVLVHGQLVLRRVCKNGEIFVSGFTVDIELAFPEVFQQEIQLLIIGLVHLHLVPPNWRLLAVVEQYIAIVGVLEHGSDHPTVRIVGNRSLILLLQSVGPAVLLNELSVVDLGSHILHPELS